MLLAALEQAMSAPGHLRNLVPLAGMSVPPSGTDIVRPLRQVEGVGEQSDSHPLHKTIDDLTVVGLFEGDGELVVVDFHHVAESRAISRPLQPEWRGYLHHVRARLSHQP